MLPFKASLTNILILVNIAIFLITVLTANFFSVIVDLGVISIEYKASNADVLLGRGSIIREDNTLIIPISWLQFYLSQVNYFVLYYHFYWQLLTAMFIHFGIIHLTFNMLALFFFGNTIEYSYGRKRFLSIYLFSGFLGNIASLFLLQYSPFGGGILSPFVPSAGASGAIFGLLGALAMIGRISGSWGPTLGFVILIFLINSFIPGVNIFAHLFGLLGGLLAGYIFVRHAMKKRREIETIIEI